MKTIGLVGGMSWESTLEYYRVINETVKKRLGGRHSAKILLYSMDFAELEELKGRDSEIAAYLSSAIDKLAKGGADFLVLCSNTSHGWVENISLQLPLLHIADATGVKVRAAGFGKVALLGTRYTMEQPFYRRCLEEKYGLSVLTPPEGARRRIESIILDEIFIGKRLESSREELKAIVAELSVRGAQAVILGCTELPLLLKQADVSLPVFDTLTIHAEAAVDLLMPV